MQEDIQELENWLGQATRDHNKQLLSKEIKTLKAAFALVINLNSMIVDAVSSPIENRSCIRDSRKAFSVSRSIQERSVNIH